MVLILRLLALRNGFDFRHPPLVLQTRHEIVTVVVLRLVRIVAAQSPEKRLVKDGIRRYVPRRTAVEREADVDPLVLLELPARDERKPLLSCR